MKVDLNFIPQNIAPKGVKKIVVYGSNGKEVGAIPLGRLNPPKLSEKIYTFGALSDIHLPYSEGKEDFIRALNYLNNDEKVDFICISGDMGSTGVESEWVDYKNHIDTYSPNTPVHLSAGNHDAGQGTPKTYEFPIPYTGNPLYYSFTQGNDVFIMFGSSFWGNPPFTNESLQWLYETLEENRNKRVFVFEHYLRLDGCGNANKGYPWDALNNTNGQVFLSLMEHYKNVLWFHGHSHSEFEHQDTLNVVNANYDRKFGCHSIHIPSCCMTRNESNSYDYEDSEGYVVDVYEDGIHLRGRDFIAEKFLPIASYWIDTTLTNITEKSYTDPNGVIDTSGNTLNIINVMEQGEIYLNKRWSRSNARIEDAPGRMLIQMPINVDGNTECTLTIQNTPSTYPITSGYNLLYLINADRTETGHVNGNEYFANMTEGFTQLGNNSCEIVFTPASNWKYLSIQLIMTGTGDTGREMTEADIGNLAITLKIGKEGSV